eukprot:scaffold21366_cov138-Isochrysis_galbana.AAC.1
MHQLSPELGPGQAPLSHSTAVSSGRPSQAPSGGERSALPLLLTLTNPEATKKKLVRLKKPRLPSALGLSGACGVAA